MNTQLVTYSVIVIYNDFGEASWEAFLVLREQWLIHLTNINNWRSVNISLIIA